MKTHARSASVGLVGRWSIALLGLATLPGMALADGDRSVVRVEEDWELVVGATDVFSDSPQITCMISTGNGTDHLHATLELNHRTLPFFEAGGLGLQAWWGEQALGHRQAQNTSRLSQEGEKASWTQAMVLKEGRVTFEVLHGQSTTWGNFGGNGHLRLSQPASIDDLNDYHPRVSVASSGVSLGANRVQSLKLVGVRLYLADGTVLRDATVYSVK